MTTKDAIKLLPMDHKLKMQVLNMYDFMEPDMKRTIQRIAWKTYFYMNEQQIQNNIDQQYQAVAEGKAAFDKNLYKNVLKNTEIAINKHHDETKGAVDLATARHAMEQIMHEIHAAKKARKSS